MKRLSVVLPAYNEELMVGKTCRVLREVLTEAEIPYELVVVNDGSADGTWAEIEKAGKKDPNVNRRFISPGTLAKRQLFLQDWPRPPVM